MHIGQKRIVGRNKLDGGKTEVTFEDATKVVFLDDVLASVETENQTDASELRDLTLKPVVIEILKTLLKYNVRLEWVDYLLANVKQSVLHSKDRAYEKLWGKPDYEVSFADVEDVLLKQ